MALPNKAVYVDGGFVSERVRQVIEAIHDYNHELEVQWIPPLARKPGDAAFRIIHRPMGREPYVVFHVKTEAEFDTRILMRLIAGDQSSGAIKYSDVEAAEKAAELVAKQRAHDQLQEDIEKMHAVLKSPLNTYRLDKDTVIKDGIPQAIKRRRD